MTDSGDAQRDRAADPAEQHKRVCGVTEDGYAACNKGYVNCPKSPSFIPQITCPTCDGSGYVSA